MFAPADAPVHPSVRRWLLLVAGMIFAMVALGGLTRLTESGLSMTEWRPLFGWLPPMGDSAWQQLFDLYRETPQYRQVFPDLTVGGFKAIFWLEYLHRLFGRLIGVVFLAGFVILLLRRRLPRRLVPPLAALFVLGGLQGALGWYMVASGLVDRPSVSHYRLAAHLSLAMILYAWTVWLIARMNRPARPAADAAAGGSGLAVAAYGSIALTVVFGAFVAGLDAGKIHNTFPLMGGALVPADYLRPGGGLAEFVANPVAVQFNHRVLAILSVLLVLALWWRTRGQGGAEERRWAGWLLAAALLQTALGIATLLLYAPVWLAALHQAGAMLLVTAAVLHAAARRRGQGV
ncbi:MAG: COX15/CtaA family protein [Rhodospirillaceae bacterium]|nr:COX15/CtaA family protein [Rhodospirillaceae bacterium]MDE0619774.1 COX15/CtaA family protein [Rhodospirillaceae bacterium]